MSEIFLSASIPIQGRGSYYETADPFLIQCAVRELVLATIKTHTIVWGGHPAITPMIWTICEDLDRDYSSSVVLYQSSFFEDRFPEENDRFRNVEFVEAVPNDRDASLLRMRQQMLGRKELTTAVFIGGMDGVEVEYKIFKDLHPTGRVICVPATGGAALSLGNSLGLHGCQLSDVDFAGLFQREIILEKGEK